MKKKITVIKRDGREKSFNKGRIEHAVRLAMGDVDHKNVLLPYKVSKFVKNKINTENLTKISIKEIEEMVILSLSNLAPEVAEVYKKCRNMRSEERELNDVLMKEIKQLGFSTNRDKWRCLLA